ncbi:MAG: ribosomal protein S18-alanine N-acetyltransferase [Candidatus Gastranaerophilales bacterium]|nr:ribosomal protein S18-alanine N-acetyltransferase [Candidatus Gastranaerophilales bacterium]
MKVSFRNMQEDDIPSIMEIETVSFGKYHWSEKSFITEINNNLAHYYIGINEDNKLVSYCGFWDILKEAHITTFAVHPDLRKQKIAQQMLVYMIKKAYDMEIKWFTLEVRESNIAAINLYKKFGFDCIGEREKYYQDNNENALIMWTENIFSDKFKNNFKAIEQSIEALN